MNSKARTLTTVVILLIIVAGLVGWAIGHHSSPSQPTNPGPAKSNQTTGVNSLISYSLPDSWQQNNCSSTGAVYVIPAGATLNCNSSQPSPIYIVTDGSATTDCNQLKTSDVQKHTCVSIFIDGHKTLKSFTQTSKSSMWDYYINTGKGVVKLDYTYGSDNNYQSGFESLVTSIKVKA